MSNPSASKARHESSTHLCSWKTHRTPNMHRRLTPMQSQKRAHSLCSDDMLLASFIEPSHSLDCYVVGLSSATCEHHFSRICSNEVSHLLQTNQWPTWQLVRIKYILLRVTVFPGYFNGHTLPFILRVFGTDARKNTLFTLIKQYTSSYMEECKHHWFQVQITSTHIWKTVDIWVSSTFRAFSTAASLSQP